MPVSVTRIVRMGLGDCRTQVARASWQVTCQSQAALSSARVMSWLVKVCVTAGGAVGAASVRNASGSISGRRVPIAAAALAVAAR